MNFVFFVVKKIAIEGRTPIWHRNNPPTHVDPTIKCDVLCDGLCVFAVKKDAMAPVT